MPRLSFVRFGLISAAAMLSACGTSDVIQVKPVDTTPRRFQALPEATTSFECSGALPAVHRAICSSEALAEADKALVRQYRERRQGLDVAGELLLEASQRQWQLSRAEQCQVDDAQPAQAVSCLLSMYQQRQAALDAWPAAQARAQGDAHALASYAEFRLAQGADDAQCVAFAESLNADVRRHGRPNPGRLPGATVVAGSHAIHNQASVGGHSVEVAVHNAGPFGGYEIRPRGLSVDGRPVLDDRTLPTWVAEQPNYGGRAHASSSQTGDYGSLDVFTAAGKTFVLVNETWGFYSPAARGESAYAGIYELEGDGLQRRCLYQTYLTPPRTNTLAGLAVYEQLSKELDQIAGDPLPGYAQHERRDNFQSWKEMQWTLLNLPLLGADAWERYGREPAIRARNDAALDALFDWSERNLANKLAYRRVLPMLQPAEQELTSLFADQGLTTDEASRAAALLLHETVARATENLQAPEEPVGMPLPPFADYSSRYAIAPAPGELERGRQFATLHSVLLNNAPGHVVQDFIDYETGALGDKRGRGPDNNSATMAAVGNVDSLQRLLDAGFDPDQRNDWGKTALMTAAQLKLADSVITLINAGADVHVHTEPRAGSGVGGPDRVEAGQSKQTALLYAAKEADAKVIDALLAAGAMQQQWSGYDRQVCTALKQNAQLGEQAQQRLQSTLCAAQYEPAPLTRAKPGNLRAGEVYVVNDGADQYPVRLLERREMTLFGRPVQVPPAKLRGDLSRLAKGVGTAAVRKAHARLAGPLTLVFDDLRQSNEELLRLKVAFPVSADASPVGGYTLDNMPALKVLSVTFDPQRNDVEGTWRALFSAALTQGFMPTGGGFVVVDIRGQPTTEYQLVVTE